MQRLALFDIDNTLISIGSGNLKQRRAMNAAFERSHGIPDASEHVPFTGGMDLPLMMMVYRKWGLIPEGFPTPPDMSAFKAAYFEDLARNLQDRNRPRSAYDGMALPADYMAAAGASHWGLVLNRRVLLDLSSRVSDWLIAGLSNSPG